MSQQDEEIRDAERVELFLTDPAIQAALKRVSDKAFEDFRNAKSDDELRAARALLTSGDRLVEILRGVQSRGKRAKIENERAAASKIPNMRGR